MKASLSISLLAILISVAALVITITSPAKVSDQEIQRQVDLALARKEKEYVQSLAPKMDRIYRDMLGPRYEQPETAPETFAELLEPAVHIVLTAPLFGDQNATRQKLERWQFARFHFLESPAAEVFAHIVKESRIQDKEGNGLRVLFTADIATPKAFSDLLYDVLSEPITLSLNDISFETALRYVCNLINCQYEISEKTGSIIVRRTQG